MKIKHDHAAAASSREQQTSSGTFIATGSLIGAVAASSCCILPLALFSLGVGGAWIGNLTALAPYQPYLIAATIGLLGYGYWLVYQRSRTACAGNQACARPASNRLLLTALAIATALVVAAIGFNIVAPYLV